MVLFRFVLNQISIYYEEYAVLNGNNDMSSPIQTRRTEIIRYFCEDLKMDFTKVDKVGK